MITLSFTFAFTNYRTVLVFFSHQQLWNVRGRVSQSRGFEFLTRSRYSNVRFRTANHRIHHCNSLTPKICGCIVAFSASICVAFHQHHNFLPLSSRFEVMSLTYTHSLSLCAHKTTIAGKFYEVVTSTDRNPGEIWERR